jgi:transcriptional regulator with XRE-family HTH domain
MSLGNKIKELRKEKNLSQDEFSEIVKIDGRQISRYENDKISPSLDILIKIVESLNVSIDYLLFDDIPKRPLKTKYTHIIEKLENIENLTKEDQQAFIIFLDAISAKYKMKEILSSIN